MQRKIGNYTIIKQIGTGGFGEVYLARQEVINRDVAMKVILPTHANQPEFIMRFQQEAEIIAKLENPHIVPLYDYWRDYDGAYLVMRYIRGGNLADKLVTSGAFEIDRAAKLLEQVAEALYVAHRNKVIHQDIKPANILLDDDGNAYLTDFGIARDFEGNVNLAEDDSKTMHGSPKYISPEHLRRKEITYRSDIYSLGLLMYEVLTGSPPYDGTQIIELLQQHVRSPMPSLQDKAPHLPAELNQPIIQATVKDPLSRYDSVLKFADDFSRVVSQLRSPATLAGVPSPQHFFSAEDTGRFDIFKPYKGLQAFLEADAGEFFGRSTLIKALQRRMVEKGEFSRFLAVIGSSGSGKSSVVRAGLIPSLRKGEIMGFPQYFITMTPNATPMRSLEGAIIKIAKNFPNELMNTLQKDDYDLNKMLELALPADGELCLFIDQFEEVFTLVTSEDQRRNFLNLLHRAVIAEKSKLRLIIAMRADFLDRPLTYLGWGDMMRERSEIVPPLKPIEVREAIEKPAEKAKLLLDEGLSDLIIEEMSQQAGALPLLQYTLNQLYEKREGITLSIRRFKQMGGISGALAQRAEEIYKNLNPEQQKVAQIVFPRLIRFGATSRTRQRVLLSEIYSLDQANPAIPEMVKIFGDNRLLTFDYDSITRFPTLEVAHEALIASWTSLNTWLNENEGALRLQERLAAETKQWESEGKEKSFLAAGTRLAQYNEIEKHPIVSLTKREVEFLEASNQAENERVAKEKRTQRLIAGLAVVMGVFGIVAMILAFTSIGLMNEALVARDAEAIAREAADTNALIARQRELAASALVNVENSPATALLLGIESLAMGDSYEGRNALLTAIQSNQRLVTFYNGHNDYLRAVAVDAETNQIVTASRDGSVIIWDGNSRYIIQEINVRTVPVNALDIFSDKVASGDNEGRIVIWEHNELHHELNMGENQIGTLAFSPDGSLLAAANAIGQIQIWSTEEYEPLQTIEAHEGRFIYSLAFSPDGSLLASGGADNSVQLWDMSGNKVGELLGHRGAVTSMAFSPDGTMLVTGGDDRTTMLWSIADQSLIWGFVAHGTRVSSLSFSDDGNYIISGGLDAIIIIWDVATGQTLSSFYNIGRSEVYALADMGNRLFVAGDNNALIEYNIGVVPRLGEQLRAADSEELLSIATAPNEYAYAGGGDFSIYRQSSDGTLTPLEFHSDLVTGLAYSNERLISVSLDRNAVIWDSDDVPLAVNNREDSIFSLAVHGETVALGLNRGSIEIWSIANNNWVLLSTLEGHRDRVSDLAFSPDGSRLISGSRDDTAILWDVANQEVIYTLEGHSDAIEAVAYSADGKYIATGSRDFNIRLWDATTGELVGAPLSHHESFVLGLAFSPDSRLLASVSADTSVILWSIPEGRSLGLPIVGHNDWVNSLAFSNDGQGLYTVSRNGSLFYWETNLEKWESIACSIANRSFSENESREYFNVGDAPIGVCIR